MFRRREKKTVLIRFGDWLWPRIGFRRAAAYWAHRISRLPGSTYAIAAGFACGAAISFSPLVGLHIVLGGIWAWLIRANIIAAVIGTAVGNPWTFPFIWVWIYNLGDWMWLGDDITHRGDLDFYGLFGHIKIALLQFDLAYLFEVAWPIFGPMLWGSLPTVIATWLIFYFFIRGVITAYRRSRTVRMKARHLATNQGKDST